MVDHELVAAARRGLAELADPVEAPPMQRYVRSAMPFRGCAGIGLAAAGQAAGS